MKSQLFRKNSIDNISSPEQLNECIKTAHVSTWIIFISVALILMGMLVWAFSGEVDIKVSSIVVCEDDVAVCYIPEKRIDEISENAEIHIKEDVYTLGEISKTPYPAKDCLSPYEIHLADLKDGEWVYTAKLNADIGNGIHKAEIVVESISPISLLID